MARLTDSEAYEYMIKSGWWDATMKPWFGDISQHKDTTLNKMCCAQFIVNKKNILKQKYLIKKPIDLVATIKHINQSST